ncbi:MAG: reprolysin-like metallopeptidase [Saprospiraceae bacterium]
MKWHSLIYIYLTSSCLLLFGQNSQTNFISTPLSGSSENDKIIIDFQSYLKQAIPNNGRSPLQIELYIQNVKMKFTALPNDIIDGELKRKFPDIFTFDLKFDGQPRINGSLTLSPTGFFATIFDEGKLISIYPDKNSTSGLHVIEYGIQKDLPKLIEYCGHDHNTELLNRKSTQNIYSGVRSDISLGSKRFNYRLAVVTTGEFYQKNGNNDTAVMTIIVNSVNSINTIYNNELSFRFTLGSRVFMYKDALTDPFTPDQSGGEDRAVQAGKVIPPHFNPLDYDIGHVFHQHANGDGWTTGGLAWIGTVCSSFINASGQANKASAWTGNFTNTGNSWVNLLAHELGHQFGATHTFNGSGGSCTGSISLNNAVEIGSGSTIMAYNGICDDPQNIPNVDALDNYFHIKSLEEIYKYVYEGQGGNCGSPANSPNIITQVNANPCNANQHIIPKGTPFYLKASGFLSDNDIHTYCWEQIDEDGQNIKPTQGLIGTAAANSPLAPLFRSYPPSVKPDRFFPSMDILNSQTGSDPFDVLPNVARDLNFNVALRDNNSAGGAIANDDIKITVSDSGPFVISNPLGGAILQAGQAVNLTWSTNGSSALCAKIRIKMSVDGGNTFPFIIAENVNYSSESYSYIIPLNFIATSKAKIIMECMDFDCFNFFSISKGSFIISNICSAPKSVLCSTTMVSENRGSQALNLNMSKFTGEQVFSIQKNINTTLPIGNVAVWTNDNAACKNVANAYYYQKAKIYATESGTYTFKIEGNGFVSIFSPQYVATSGCSGFVFSSAKESVNPGFINRTQNFSVDLKACTDYEFLFYSFATLPVDVNLKLISGPGILFEKNVIPQPNYQNVYVLVDKISGIAVYAGESSDFRTIPAGQYILYSVSIEKSVSFFALINQNYAQVKKTLCLNEGLNSREITIKPSCAIINITAGVQSLCNSVINKYTQDVILTYSNPPTTGQININGQLFNITGSPQTIKLIGLESDGNPVSLSAQFTAQPDCILQRSNLFIAPQSCCPIDLKLGNNIVRCQGDGTVKIEASTDTTNVYKWSKDGQAVISNQGGVLFVTASGLYGVEVTHPSGCKKSDTIRVTFNSKPLISLPDNPGFCENDKYTLNATVSGATNIEWFKDNNLISGSNTNSLDITSGGLYKVVATNSFGCKSEYATTVTSIKLPSVELGNNIDKCAGDDPVILNVGMDTSYNYRWTKNGLSIPSNDSGILMVSSSGLYGVEVINSSGCKNRDSVIVNFNSFPVVSLIDKVVFCENSKYTLAASISGSANIKWFKNNIPINAATSEVLEISTAGTYKVSATNEFGCTSMAETAATTLKSPVVKLGNNQIKCEGETVNLNAGNDGTKYQWFKDGSLVTDATQNIITINESGNYKVVVTNSELCKSEDTIRIDFFSRPKIEDFPSEINTCQGSPFSLIAKVTNFQSLQWYFNNSIIGGSISPNLPVFNSGNYGIEATNIAGCKTRKDTRVEVRSLPVLDLGPDVVSCQNMPVVLFAGTEGILYNWARDGQPIFNTENNLPVLTTGTYQVSVTNSFNCTATDEKKVSFSTGPTVTLNGDVAICEGINHFITITTNAVNPEIKWFKNAELIPDEIGSSLNVTLQGTYEAWVKGGSPACTTIKSVNITVNPRPALNLGNERKLCDPPVFPVLNAGQTNVSFVWSLDGNQISTQQTVTADKSGIYSVKVKNNFGCERTEQVKILISTYPSLIIDTSYVLCEGSDLIVNAVTNGTKYQWRRNDILIPSAINKTLVITQAGKYTMISSNDADCRTEASFNVVSRPRPVLELGADTTLCPGAVKLLNAGIQNSYVWSDGSTTPTINVSAGIPATAITKKYAVTVFNEFGCSNKDSIFITLIPIIKATIMADNTAICKGISVQLTASGGQIYKWSETGGSNTLSNTSQATTKATPTKTTIYTVEVSNNLCSSNKDTKSIEIKVYDDSAVSAGRDTCIIAGRSLKLKASGGKKYQWDNIDLISGSSDIAEPIVSPIKETTFNVVITDTNGCNYDASVKICIKAADVKQISIITPNNDGKNDELIFPGLTDFPNNNLKIYNRWGNIVFEAIGYQVTGILFNGERNGERLPADTYYYVLTYDNKIIKSALTLLWD